MNTLSILNTGLRELAHRSADGIDVTLLWTSLTDTLSVVVRDWRTNDAFELVLDSTDDALDVFHHPYAYAAWRGIDYRMPESQAA
jgi:hypothetical protein